MQEEVLSTSKNNCPLRFYLGLNLSTRLRKSNFDYFTTKCYGQLSIQWTIVHNMSISWTRDSATKINGHKCHDSEIGAK